MAALSIAIEQARRKGATNEARQRQLRAELRLEEIVKVAGIADEYEAVDRAGDLDIETHFGRLYQNAADERMRTLVTRAFMAWQRDEANEERIVRESVGSSVTVLKGNNPVWIDGAAVPSGSDGAA